MEPKKKQISVVCKSNSDDKLKILYEHVARQLELDNYLDAPKELINQIAITTEKSTMECGECRWFYCPAYHFCPFEEAVIGIKGRSHKKKIDVKFEGINNTPKSTNTSNFGFRDGVEVEVIKGNISNNGTL